MAGFNGVSLSDRNRGDGRVLLLCSHPSCTDSRFDQLIPCCVATAPTSIHTFDSKDSDEVSATLGQILLQLCSDSAGCIGSSFTNNKIRATYRTVGTD